MPIGCLMLPRFAAEVQGRRGRAIAVHHRGRLIACSHQAEQAGLTANMPLGQAQAVCPHAQFLAYNQDQCRAFQRRVLDICAAHSAAVEPVSPYEIFLDLNGASSPAQAMAEVAEAAGSGGITCRTGVASSKLVARIAALVRPGRAVAAGNEAGFLAPLPISRLWPLDGDTVEHLQALGLHTIGLLQQTPLSQLTLRFGRAARRLSELAFGRDPSPVRPLYPPPLIEARIALPDGVGDASPLEAFLRRLASRLAEQLAARRQTCGALALEIETDDGQTHSRSQRLITGALTRDDLLRAARRLLARLTITQPITGFTLRAGDLQRCEDIQGDLFGANLRAEHRGERLAGALASAQQQFGSRALLTAGELEIPRRERLLSFYIHVGADS